MTLAAPNHPDAPGVNFFSPVATVSGLGAAGRGYLAALRSATIPVCLVPLNEMFVHHASVGIAERSQRPRHPISLVQVNADSVRRFLHFQRRPFARARYKIAMWVWELPALRSEWHHEIDHFDEIWVPSTFCQRAVQAVTAKPVTVVPYAVMASSTPNAGMRQKLGIPEDKFVFLYIFDAASFVMRKNPHCLVDAFRMAFPSDSQVRLVLKVSHIENSPDLSTYLDALAASDPRYIVVRNLMGEDELTGLLLACNCYVSPHRSEGFGLTVAEAMALGLPVIATDYGGTADFVSDDVGFPLRYRLIELDQDYGPYAKGAVWSDPSREHLRKLLQTVIANPDAAAAKGRLARQRIASDYSAAAVGRHIAKRLSAIAVEAAL